ncbi:MAG: phytanoyl-CoA dioxygenase family protein [Actinomycetota bacterium]|nr:phytanoyl-CoA dioxygenase family protein [Actinomycetota bacterium]
MTFERDGFFRIEGFANVVATCTPMLDRVVDISRRAAAGEDVRPALVLPEANLVASTDATGPAPSPEDLVSKVFRLHRDPVFHEFATDKAVTDIVAGVLGTGDVDCFLSQFIFKAPGAWGQPWHQDSYYFPFEPARPVVGVWLAVTEATLDNGCLHVVRGSHAEPVHEHVPDRRPGANYGYVEIVDHDMAAAEPVLMQPGDLLVFDSHLMHRSTDNVSDGIRAAMVYHYAPAGTTDHTKDRSGYTINDWMPARRSVSPV